MKNIYRICLLFFIFFPISIFSQVQKDEELMEKMWMSPDKDFQRTNIPAEYQNESVVIICKEVKYEGFNKSGIAYKKYLHERIKIMDNSAIRNYSLIELNSFIDNTPSLFFNFETIFFTNKENYTQRVKIENFKLGVKILKSDGTEIIVDVDNIVSDEIKSGYNKYITYKLAIPNLEIGDILDYYIVSEVPKTLGSMELSNPIFSIIPEEYPILKYKAKIELNRKCYVNFSSLNGAPEFKKENMKKPAFTISMENIQPTISYRWINPYRVYPAFKFQFFKPNFTEYIDKRNIFRKHFTEIEKQRLFENLILTLEDKYTPRTDLHEFADKKLNGVNDLDQKIKKSVYYVRQHIYRDRFLKNYIKYDKTDINCEKRGEPEYADNDLFLSMLIELLKYQEIPFEVFFTTSNNLGNASDILIPYDIIKGVRIKTDKETYYISALNKFSTINELPENYLGNTAYSIPYVKKRSYGKMKTIDLPKKNTVVSGERAISTIQVFGDKMDSLNIQKESTIVNHSKYYFQNNLINSNDYLANCRDEQYGFVKLDELKIQGLDKDYSDKKYYNKVLQDSSDRILRLKKILISEYGTKYIKVKDFKLVKSGMWDDDSLFIYHENFSLKGFVLPAGPNYLVEIGRLIGRQVELSENELERDRGVYLETPREFTETIHLQVPDGYDIVGVENLKMSVVNETGSFEAIPIYEDRVLKVTTTKKYNQTYVEKEKWPLMVEFLNAATDFSYKKVLLKKL
jgi:hypothetical protein